MTTPREPAAGAVVLYADRDLARLYRCGESPAMHRLTARLDAAKSITHGAEAPAGVMPGYASQTLKAAGSPIASSAREGAGDVLAPAPSEPRPLDLPLAAVACAGIVAGVFVVAHLLSFLI